MPDDSWARIRSAFASPSPEPELRWAPQGVSAVLLALFASSEGPALLYTERAASMRSHAGEISFPGGRLEPGDAGPLAAALREADEEVGLSGVRVLGHLTDYLTHRDVLVCAYVGEGVGAPPSEPRSAAEVARVFAVPVARLLEPGRYEARRIDGMAPRARVHYWRVPEGTIWGITGELTARFLARAFAWAPPSEAREVATPSELRPGRP